MSVYIYIGSQYGARSVGPTTKVIPMFQVFMLTIFCVLERKQCSKCLSGSAYGCGLNCQCCGYHKNEYCRSGWTYTKALEASQMH